MSRPVRWQHGLAPVLTWVAGLLVAFHPMLLSRFTRMQTDLGDTRLALLGVSDRPILATRTMALLAQDPNAREAAVEMIGAEIEPAEDPAYPPAYRRHLVKVLLRRALSEVPP